MNVATHQSPGRRGAAERTTGATRQQQHRRGHGRAALAAVVDSWGGLWTNT